jgi:hypothetical protein
VLLCNPVRHVLLEEPGGVSKASLKVVGYNSKWNLTWEDLEFLVEVQIKKCFLVFIWEKCQYSLNIFKWMSSWSYIYIYNKENKDFSVYTGDRDSRIIWNMNTVLPDYAVSYPRRWHSSSKIWFVYSILIYYLLLYEILSAYYIVYNFIIFWFIQHILPLTLSLPGYLLCEENLGIYSPPLSLSSSNILCIWSVVQRCFRLILSVLLSLPLWLSFS